MHQISAPQATKHLTRLLVRIAQVETLAIGASYSATPVERQLAKGG